MNMMIQTERWSHQPVPYRRLMVELPEGRDWEMVVFDVDGTLMDVDGYHPDLIPLIRLVFGLALLGIRKIHSRYLLTFWQL